jgi:predicted Zn-dependent peptidase
MTRFVLPAVGAATGVRFPPIVRETLASGLAVWTIRHAVIPTVTLALVVDGGTARDPADQPGLAGLAADMIDEGAGGRDAIGLAEAFARVGSASAIDVGPEITTIGSTALSRHLPVVMGLVADIAVRPHFEVPDLERVRDLRRNRLVQLRTSPGPVADRAFLGAVFGRHPYGHGALGTTASLGAMTIDEVRAFHEKTFRPSSSTLIVAGDVTPAQAIAAARDAFGGWRDPATPAHRDAGALRGPSVEMPVIEGVPGPVVLVDRPGAPQSELRVGHTAPPRTTPAYHALMTLNAILGGQFSSRLNANLREAKGYTYGARSGFDLRRAGGSFSCDTSVQADATAAAVVEILREFAGVRTDGSIGGQELARAQAALTRGYVRGFETAEQIVRAAVQLAAFALPDDTFDRFVPAVDALTAADVVDAARRWVRPDESAVVVVGDLETLRQPLEALGRPLRVAVPEF